MHDTRLGNAWVCVRLRAVLMTAWLRTDEKKEVFEALKFARRLLDDVEGDPYYRTVIDASRSPSESSIADAICASLRQTARLVPVIVLLSVLPSGET